ncbi:hypothetical protein [Micromonospora sp. DT47]|uniref:hypothetical protein n=1 Tax=Micromonospora sp. DT47 TaxID=3393431 RepID=UPI003CE72251
MLGVVAAGELRGHNVDVAVDWTLRPEPGQHLALRLQRLGQLLAALLGAARAIGTSSAWKTGARSSGSASTRSRTAWSSSIDDHGS